MKEFIHVLRETLRHTEFVSGSSTTYSLEQLRALYEHDRKHCDAAAAWTVARVPEQALAALAERLRELLKDYIDPDMDRLGTGLVGLLGGQANPTVAEFAGTVIRAAATLGTVRVTELLHEWIDGKPLRYHLRALLNGVAAKLPLEVKEGLRIQPVPRSREELAILLPALTIHMRSYHDFMRGAILSVPCEAEPALYPKSGILPFFAPLNHTYAQGRLPEFSVEQFCEALSLVCNIRIRHKFSWHDVGELQEFNTLMYSGPHRTDAPDHEASVELSQQHLDLAMDVYLASRDRQKTRPALGTAIHRWTRSKRWFPLPSYADCFVELRMALEALYLNDVSAELSYRLATRAAWHLGRDPDERREIHDTLLRVYRVTSKAVHAGNIEFDSKSHRLLEAGQNLCRRGILQSLEETEPPDWTTLILGGDPDSVQGGPATP
ncbi:MAG: hypothetical protein OXQ89_04845 [Rhodospirillaceae bacterium]|nr:hypothetical protein [Rhodospirillaceae bacterium]